MEHDFFDHVILVTGGTGALGSKVVELFLKFSPKAIIISYRSDKEMQELKPKILEKNSGEGKENNHTLIEFVKVDITNEDSVKTLISIIMEKFGQVHVLANVVGGYIGGKSVSETDEEEWDKMMSINLKSAFFISKHVLAHMKKKKFGKIVHVSSASGAKANGNDSAYAASKAGLIRLVESMAEESRGFNITINCILPTIIDTESNRRAMPTADFSTWILPAELAKVICFLSS
ncbi:MAG TPA: SDR family NAD(P)-dependent oxidoreductase, partial [Candidatus Nitrosocosmicus sp.]|nr:SDR family NAD(P)-dependent oxidoreductase [Candidatus Nitrosocosmicus sp.]